MCASKSTINSDNIALASRSYDQVDNISKAEKTTTEMYRGFFLTFWILRRYKTGWGKMLLTFIMQCNVKSRTFVQCVYWMACADFFTVTRGYSSKEFVNIPQGVRANSINKLQDVINHALSPMHEAALQTCKNDIEWKFQIISSAWIKSL